MYKIKQIMPSLYHFEFKRKHDLFLSVMKCQEFYECQDKKIKGKKFTLEDVIVAYSNLNEHGDFSYFQDFSAFNFPDVAVKKYLKLNSDTLLEREKIVLGHMMKLIGEDDLTPTPKVYFIATYTNENPDSKKDVKHEIAHGLYYTQSMYRRVMDELLWSKRELLEKIYIKLHDMMYCDDVLPDEAQAYLSTSTLKELYEFGFPKCITEKDLIPFKEAYNSFAGHIKQKRKRRYRNM